MNNKQLVKTFSGKKVMVEFVALVNKVAYYVQANNPDIVYTALEVRKIRTK